MSELAGEKIDIIDWSEDPATFVGNALSPSKVVSVTVLDARSKTARVVVPDFQLSLAIGKEGQNARLAARLTGWRIDIRSDADPRGAGMRRPRQPGSRADRCRDGDGRLSAGTRSTSGVGAGCCATLRSGPQLGFGSRMSDPHPALAPTVGPVRTCVGCRTRSSADGLLRVVVVHGVLTPDPWRRLPGRGAWLHPAAECLDRAERRSAFPRALRVPGPLDTAAVRAHIAAGSVSGTASGIRERPGSVTSGSKVDPS